MQKESLKNEFTIKSNFSNKFYNMREHKHGNTKTKVSHLILKYRLVSIVFTILLFSPRNCRFWQSCAPPPGHTQHVPCFL